MVQHSLMLVSAAFRVLGIPAAPGSPSFCGFVVQRWMTPSFSPIILRPGMPIGTTELEAIDEFFRRHPIDNPALDSRPYFLILRGKVGERVMNAVGEHTEWCVDPTPLSLECSRIASHTAEGVASQGMLVSERPTLPLPSDYEVLLRRSFGADDNYLAAVESAFRDSDASSITVLLRSPDESPLAGGTVSVRGTMAFLTWGCVDPAARGLGLHRHLVAACAKVAAANGATSYALTTRNPRVRGRCDVQCELFICRRGQSQRQA